MKWQGRQRSSNIEDRRTSGGSKGGFGGGLGGNPFGRGSGGSGFRIPAGGRSGGGIGGIIIVVIIGIVLFSMGINPIDLLNGMSGGSNTTSSSSSSMNAMPSSNAGEDELAEFVGVVIKETEDVWGEKFSEIGETYVAPKVVLFTGATDSGCGQASADSGPFYCPVDQKVYIDLSFYDQLRQQFGAPGDFAQAYVLAHEVGHHVQNLEGTLPEFNQRRQAMSQDEANAYSVRVELQADCYAGVWAHEVGQLNLLDAGDNEEAITAANSIGDDTLQREMQGRVVPRTFTHGTSAQRMAWLKRGMQSGQPSDCDTFSGQI